MIVTFLELVQRFILEASGTGSISTVVNQTGENLRYVTWVNQAWLDIQNHRRDWKWMRSSGMTGGGMSFTTVSGTAVYPLGSGAGTCGVASASFGDWLKPTFRCFTTAQGNTGDEMLIGWIDYDTWRDGYEVGPQRAVTTRPVIMSIAPNMSICVGPPPTGSYTITGDYETRPTLMTVADDSTPTGLDSQYQMAIVYKALISYGYERVAQEVIERSREEYRILMRQLERLQLPMMSWGGPLA